MVKFVDLKNIHCTAIIVTVENDKKLLPGCIKSLTVAAKEAGITLDCIIVANGVELDKRFLPTLPLQIISIKKKVGFGQAFNRGMKTIKSSWCILACPDTKADPMCIKNMLPHCTPDMALIAPKIVLPDNTIQPTILPPVNLWNIFIEQSYLYKLLPSVFRSPLSDTTLYERNNDVSALAAIWWIINKDAFETVGGFDEQFALYFEDSDVCKRLREHGLSLRYVSTAHVGHTPHQSTQGITNGQQFVQSLVTFLKKHTSRLTMWFGLLFIGIGSLLRLVYWMKKKNKQKIIELSTMLEYLFNLPLAKKK